MEFRILGPLEVVDEHGRRVELAGSRQRALLEILLLHANQVVSSDRLIEELWAERPPPTAAKSLQGHVLRLRRAVGDARIVTQDGGYVLRLAAGELDAERLERAVLEGVGLEEALALWRGPPLVDLADAPFAQGEIARLEELHLTALELRIDGQLAAGRQAQVIGELEALVGRHPFRERLRAQLMLALYRAGRQAEALEAYRDARRALVEELGIEPSAELRELERAILAQDSALAAPAAERVAPTGIFVGRARELAALAAMIERTLAGRGGVCLIGGEPGIGKSRLAEEAVAMARRRGARVLIGRCWEAGGAPPYWPWVQSLRAYARECDATSLRSQLGTGAAEIAQLLPELRELVPGGDESVAGDAPASRFQLFDALSGFLRHAAASQPLLFAFDDLHAADEPSLLLLRFLTQSLADTRILVLGAYRDTEAGPPAPLADALIELKRVRGVEQLILRGLEQRDTARFLQLSAALEHAPRLAAALQRETEGNPLFVSELVRLLAAEDRLHELEDASLPAVPAGVRDVIAQRLQRLSPECRQTLTLAAVFGREFRIDALEAVGGEADDDLLVLLEEGLGTRIIGDVPGARGRMRFSHALVRDALYVELSGARRARLHRRIGQALERLYADNLAPHLSELAHHLLEALPDAGARKAIEYARRAAEQAERVFAYEEACVLYDMALQADAAECVSAEERCELLLAMALARNRADGDGPRPREIYLRAAEEAKAAGLPTHQARAAFGYSGLYNVTRATRAPAVVGLLEDALNALPETDDVLRATLLGRLSATLRQEPSRARREALGRQAVELARRTGDPETLAVLLQDFWLCIRGPDNIEELKPLEDEIVTLCMGRDLKHVQIGGHDYKIFTAWELGDAATVELELARARRLVDELREPGPQWLVLTVDAMLALSHGDLELAERLFKSALELPEIGSAWHARAYNKLQLFALRREQARLADVEPLLDGDPNDWVSPLGHRCVTAYIHAARGRADDARRALDDLLDLNLGTSYLDEGWLFNVSLLPEVCAAVGHVDAAAAVYELLLPYRQRVAVARHQASLGCVARALGIAARLMGRFAEAADHFETALEVDDRMGDTLAVARTRGEYQRARAGAR